jgi:hypothetical protein
MADSNYYLFFKLYRGAPAMGAYLMDYCVDRLRKVAMTIMTKVRCTLEASIVSMMVECASWTAYNGGDVAAMLSTDTVHVAFRHFVQSSPSLLFSSN